MGSPPALQSEFLNVSTKGNQSWIFIGRTDAEVEAPILWPPDAKNWLIGKDPDAGKDWRQEEKGMTEDGMVGWHHWLTQWTWVGPSSGIWWWIGKPDMLQSMGSQRVGHNWANELKWTGPSGKYPPVTHCSSSTFKWYFCALHYDVRCCRELKLGKDPCPGKVTHESRDFQPKKCST